MVLRTKKRPKKVDEGLVERLKILELRAKRLDIMMRALEASRKKGIRLDFDKLEEAVSRELGLTVKLNRIRRRV